MSDLAGPNLRRFRSRDDDGGHRVANDGRPVTPHPIRRLSAPVTEPFPVVAPPDDAAAGEHVDDLIAGYALGALEPDERLAVERHAAYCPNCARLLAETRRTASMLSFVAAPAAPSPDVKAALFSRIAQSSAPLTAEQADAFAWSRPVTPRRSVTLPASGTWLESQPVVESGTAAMTVNARRPRRNLVRTAGISIPVLLTFGLLALFVVPRFLPSDDPQNQQLVQLLNSGPTECGEQFALLTSRSLASACGFINAAQTADGPVYTLTVSNVVDETPVNEYVINIPAVDGGFVAAGSIGINGQGQGREAFFRPDNASDDQVCLTEPGEDANLVCNAPRLTPAA